MWEMGRLKEFEIILIGTDRGGGSYIRWIL